MRHTPPESGSTSSRTSIEEERTPREDIIELARDAVFTCTSIHLDRSHNSGENACASENFLVTPVVNARGRAVAVLALQGRRGDSREFSLTDKQFVEAFATFSGLAINNAQLYEKAVLWSARQQVALELISYHATAGPEQVDELLARNVAPAARYSLYSFDFDDTKLSDMQTLEAAIAMFVGLDLIEQFRIDYTVLCRCMATIKKNYRKVKYHNWWVWTAVECGRR